MKLSQVKPGDRVKVTTTSCGVVKEVDTKAQMIKWAEPATVSYVIEKRKHPKPEAGAVITGQQVRDTWWKRGTMLARVGPLSLHGTLVLHGSGLWHSLDTGLILNFASFCDDDQFKVVYVA